MSACYKCGRGIPEGVWILRPVDPPGTPKRRWACENHFDQFAYPEVEQLISIITQETKH